MSYTPTSINSILNIELGMLEKEIIESTDLNINEEELTSEDVEDLKSTIADLPENVTTEKVEERNRLEKSTNSYGTVRIQNDSDYMTIEECRRTCIESLNLLEKEMENVNQNT